MNRHCNFGVDARPAAAPAKSLVATLRPMAETLADAATAANVPPEPPDEPLEEARGPIRHERFSPRPGGPPHDHAVPALSGVDPGGFARILRTLDAPDAKAAQPPAGAAFAAAMGPAG